MSAWVQPIETEQGATFTLGFVYHNPVIDNVTGLVTLDSNGDPVPGTAKSLAGCTARMQIRQTLKKEAVVTGTSQDPVAFPEQGGRILLEAGAVTGRIDIVLTDADTDLITFEDGVYDLELEYPLQTGELRPFVERILMGSVTNTLNVTKVDT